MDALVLHGRSTAVKYFLCESSHVCERDMPSARVEAAVGKASGKFLLMHILCPHRITGQR